MKYAIVGLIVCAIPVSAFLAINFYLALVPRGDSRDAKK